LGAILSKLSLFSLLTTVALTFPSSVFPQTPGPVSCPAADAFKTVESPKELRSRNGRLQVSLWMRNSLDSSGQMQYCYVDEHGDRSPTLRVRPGDLVLLKLKNELSVFSTAQHPSMVGPSNGTSATMTKGATNLHFHGLSVSPSFHADDSLHTSIPPSAKAFMYHFRIPTNQPPGLYWYHPHPHGYSEEQVLGGASGALIVEGIAHANPLVAGLPERVLVIRDQRLHLARANSNRDPSLPAKDLSINFIRVPYPEYPVPIIETRPLTRELWRVLNASADTYVNLGVLFNGEWQASGLAAANGSWQALGLVALDGVPLSEANSSKRKVLGKTEILIPPGGRAEFIFQTPPEGIKAELFTVGVDTNPPEDEDNDTPVTAGAGFSMPDTDDNTPPRPLAKIVSSHFAVEPPALSEAPAPASLHQVADLATISPVRQRELYFSEKVMDPKHPDTSTIFYITEAGHTPKAFDASVLAPDIVVHQGDVEDWTIENRSQESHAFHIHQLHFLLLERDGDPAGESYLLDTVDLPYWDGRSAQFPRVKLRMDFRDANIVGTFPYHCHILQHVDGGMMGLIQVRPKLQKGHARSDARYQQGIPDRGAN
jgi:FtsP/CotA-like multicopper oxidase with cupredoxin domain